MRKGRPAQSVLVFAAAAVAVVAIARPLRAQFTSYPRSTRNILEGNWQSCREADGRYSERGIKDRHGYGSERFRVEPEFLIKIDPALGHLGVLLEPASILAKAWEHIERIGCRPQEWRPQTLLVTGAGPIGLLAAMMGAHRGLDVHVFDHHQSGMKPSLVCGLGGTYYNTALVDTLEHLAPDIIIECTGVPSVIRDVLARTSAVGIVVDGINAVLEKREIIPTHHKVAPELVVRESTRSLL